MADTHFITGSAASPDGTDASSAAERTAPNQRRAGWLFMSLVWIALCAAPVYVLVNRLAERVNPWQRVLTIPSGQPREADWHQALDDHSWIDLSSDARMLAVGRANGQCEVWNLETLKCEATLGQPRRPNRPDDSRWAWQVRWFNADRDIAVYQADGGYSWEVFAPDGLRPSWESHLDHVGEGAASPTGSLLAFATFDGLHVVDTSTGEVTRTWKLHHLSPWSCEVAWAPDGKRVLLMENYRLWLWDAQTGDLVFSHGMLDLNLPSPSHSEAQDAYARYNAIHRGELPESWKHREQEPHEALAAEYRANFAWLHGAQISPDGRALAVVYRPDNTVDGFNPSIAHRVRLYDAATGQLLLDQVLNRMIQHWTFSPDGSRLYVVSWKDFRCLLHTIDVARRHMIGEIPCRRTRRVAPLPGGRWVVASDHETRLLDTEQVYAPLTLTRDLQTQDILVTPDGRTVIEAGTGRTVHVWRRKRPMAVYGAWALPETGWLYATFAVAFAGLIVISGREGTKRLGRHLPLGLWVVALFVAASAGLAEAEDIMDRLTGPMYAKDYKAPDVWRTIVSCGAAVLFLLALTGAVRGNRRWWKVLIGLESLGLIVLLVVSGLIVWVAFSTEFPPGVWAPYVWHGWLIRVTSARQLLWFLPVLLLPSVVSLIVLLHGKVRSVHRAFGRCGVPPARHPRGN